MPTLVLGLCADPAVLRAARHAERLRSVDVVVLPELADGGYAALNRGGGRHIRGDQLWAELQEASREFRSCVVGGSMQLANRSGIVTNTSPVFVRGRLVHRYDKIHLFRPTGDRRFFSRGGRIGGFSWRVRGSIIRAGVILCYDLRFPELSRVLALDGVQVLFVPARWPATRDTAWYTLLRARAIENQIVVVGCNAQDTEGGRSYVFDPLGRELFASPRRRRSAFSLVSVDLRCIAEARRLHKNLEEAVLLRHAVLPRKLPSPRRSRAR